MSPPPRFVLRLFLFAWILCGSFIAYAQPDSLDAIAAPRLKRSVERDPKLLVEALTAGKTGEVEKFDAIFSWVASTIKYDYRQYFSGEGSSAETDIKRVLRSKRAICFQYSALMDHLCVLADIRSVTVTGYAKDMLFDVGDTLYFDNHAWNAVNLDDRWHLYDVTWSAGGYEWRLTRFSERMGRWRQWIADTKVRPRRQVIRVRLEGNDFCGIKSHREKKVRMVPGLSFFWRVSDKVLSRFDMRYVIDHGKPKNRDYYLTDPRLFAITHFPNVPHWSLTSEFENVDDFAADSAYYHLDKNTRLAQKPEGSVCLPCDNFFALTPLEQEKLSIRLSLANNPRNTLTSATDYFDIAGIFYKDAELATDSLEKVSNYDSTLLYLKEARTALKRGNQQNTAFHRFHFDKESQKVKRLKEINEAHLAVNVENVSELRSRANKMKLMRNKMSSLQRKYLRSNRALLRYRPKNPASKPMKEETADKLRERVAFHESRIDSLDSRIEALEASLIDRIGQLSDNVWREIGLLYPQYRYFSKSSSGRSVSLLDNRDKYMAQLGDSILKYERSLSESIADRILFPSDTLYAEFKELEKCSRFRDADQLKTLKLYGQLYVGNAATHEELEAARTRFAADARRDYCYFFLHRLPLTDFAAGYQSFRAGMYGLYRVIRADTKAEQFRHKVFVREILLTKKRIRHVVSSNLKYQAAFKKEVMKARRNYIKEQKELNK